METPTPTSSPSGLRRGVYLIPSLFTTGTLFLGFFAIVQALHHNFSKAAWAIVIAGICDCFDGRIARMAKAESKFGLEYDSLADLVAFGLAPSVLIYGWSLASFDRLGWLATFFYVACGALRLARYNVQVNTVERRYFQGLPIPMAAAPLATTILMYQHLNGQGFPLHNWWILSIPVLLASFMISTLPFRGVKHINIRKRHSFFWLVGLLGFVLVLALEPVWTLFICSWLYVASGVIEELFTRRHSREVVARLRKSRDELVAQRAARRKLRVLPTSREQQGE